MIGKTIWHYRILSQLGGGGMGVVYEAEDLKLHRHVALKFLPVEMENDPGARERFQREAFAASALNHPNICTVYEIDEANGQHFIAMELLQGQTLNHRISGKPFAIQLYLKGRYFTAQFTPESLAKGLNYFQQAIALDPAYALAYDGISYYYAQIEDITVAPAEVRTKVEEAARKAIELDDSLVEPHVEQAYNYMFYDFDWPAAEREFQRAFSLNPDYAQAHEWYSAYLISQGRFDQAIQEGQRAVELDLLSTEVRSMLGLNLYLARRYDQAAVELHKTLEPDPNY